MRALIKNCVFVGVSHKKGKSQKTGEDYSFYSARVADEEFNVFDLNLSDELVADKILFDQVSGLKKQECDLEVDFRPKGFGISGTVVSVDTH